MNWQKSAIDDLKLYRKRKAALLNIRERIQSANEGIDGLKAVVTDRVPLSGGGSKYEERVLENMVERERLKATYKATKRLVDITERGLSGLSDDERAVLFGFFVDRTSNYVTDLCERLGYEKTKIYEIKNRALYVFTVSAYGLSDY